MTQQISLDEMINAIDSEWFIEETTPRLQPSPIPAQCISVRCVRRKRCGRTHHYQHHKRCHDVKNI